MFGYDMSNERKLVTVKKKLAKRQQKRVKGTAMMRKQKVLQQLCKKFGS